MNLRMFLILAGSILLLSCESNSGIEESVKIYDANKNAHFMRILDEKNVTYRVAPDGQIFYPLEQREEVREANEEVFGPIDKSKKGVSVKNQDADDIASKLAASGINFEVIHGDKSATFTWSSRVDTEAMRVVSEVVSVRERAEK